MSLRTRLLASYLLLLTITLGVIAIALFIILGAQPQPRVPTYARLSTLAQGLNLRELINLPRPADTLQEYAQTRDVRVMAININGDQHIIAYDSAGEYQAGDLLLDLHVDASYANSRLEQTLNLMPRIRPVEQLYGDFANKDGAEWLFSALVASDRRQQAAMLLLAEPLPVQPFQQRLIDFGTTLGLPMIQSALAGGIIAVILAAVISRTIARPLQALAQAAANVAEGHLEQSVPVTGPTEVRSVAEAFNRMSEEVRSTQQAQRDFLANVSHDLKTPLTSIQGYSQAIMDGTAKDPAHAADIIHDEAGRLNRMVIELTDLARIQAGRLSMKTAAIDMGQIAATVARKLEVVAKNKNIALEVDTPRMPEIAGDGDRLVQVLNNLIDNAIKYTPNGGRVFVKTQVNRNGVEVIVADSGPGIPQSDLPRIFERFYQVDKARGPSRGTGLGLAITREIVQSHGGRIDVQSAAGKGTMFTVWFPSPHVSTVVRGR
mgnify:CR=1 FL=1